MSHYKLNMTPVKVSSMRNISKYFSMSATTIIFCFIINFSAMSLLLRKHFHQNLYHAVHVIYHMWYYKWPLISVLFLYGPESDNYCTCNIIVKPSTDTVLTTKTSFKNFKSRGPPTACQHCGQTLTIEHMLSWVQYYSKFVMNITQLTHWGPSLRRFPRLHSRVSERSWNLLSMNGHISSRTHYLNYSLTNEILDLS